MLSLAAIAHAFTRRHTVDGVVAAFGIRIVNTWRHHGGRSSCVTLSARQPSRESPRKSDSLKIRNGEFEIRGRLRGWTTTRIECYGATRPQQGRSQNEDAFLISTGDRPFAALADGAGNAERAAKRILTRFEKLLHEATPEQVADAGAWAKWVKLLDSSLLGAAQSTFVAVTISGSEVIGACAGDSRLYHLNKEGQCRIISEGASKQRLGSGQAQPFPIRLTLNAGEVLLLLSDGAWTPLNLYALQKATVSAAARHFSEVPVAILDAAGKTGRADDMTAVALRLGR